jgi:hypothetical protein
VSPANVAAAFAAVYARYLDGRLPAASLPALGPAVVGELGPVVPRSARDGKLAVQSLQRVTRTPAFSVELRDRAHLFPARVTVGVAPGGRWVVSGVVAPDLDTILHSRTTPIPQPPGSAAAWRAARGFLAGYLRWLYGAGPAGAICCATSALLARLKAGRPDVPPAFQGLHARVDSLGLQAAGLGWRAFALVADPYTTYTLVATITLTGGRWLVATVAAAS